MIGEAMKTQLMQDMKLYDFKPLNYYMDEDYSFSALLGMDLITIKITFFGHILY